MKRWTVSPLLVDGSIPEEVRREVVDTTDDDRMAVIVELNLQAGIPPDGVVQRFTDLFQDTAGSGWQERKPYEVAPGYQRCLLTSQEISELLRADHQHRDPEGRRAIFRIWPDYVLRPQIDYSCSTIKVDAASRAYAASGTDIVWAVLDTGIDGSHPHFSDGTLTDPRVKGLHADFTWLVRREAEPKQLDQDAALRDGDGHGTHVAGIIAGRTPDGYQPWIAELRAASGDDRLTESDWPTWKRRQLDPRRRLAGMAPDARLVSLKVFDSSNGHARTTSSTVIAALRSVRQLNTSGRNPQIHGVNLSFGCRWLPEDYAAGQSPLCQELDLLVGTGVVAVVSAGNAGSASGSATEAGEPDLHGVLASITEPGHADQVITVGSTHRDRPHTYGVSYTSAKGPTLDGRPKPDLVAPGERITSAATGRLRDKVPILHDPDEATSSEQHVAYYVEESGTSMAAPHVSGAIAAFLSIRREFIGQPEEVKRLFCEAAVPLGRDRFFQGHGLVDLMGVLSKV
jgi:subtilisin family serine protease